MSSTDPTRVGGDDLPAALPAMWRALRRGFDAEPALLSIAFTLSLLAALPDALMAVWLKLLADGLLGDDSTLVMVAAAGLAASATLTWALRVASDRTQRRFRDRVTIALESHVAGLQASVATVEHHERPAFLDRLAVLRNQVFVLDHMYMSLFTTGGWILRLAVTIGLLMSIHPALALLALFALPTVATASWRPAVERAAEQSGAQAQRLARHLFDTATTAAPGKDVRVTGIGRRLVRDRRAAWERWYRPVAAARWASAGWHTLGWSVFGAGYVGAVVFVASGLRASPGDVLLLLAAGLAPGRLRRRDGRRDRLPARHLARRLAAPGVAGGLRGGAARARRPAGPGGHRARHRAGEPVVRLSRHRAAGAGERRPHAARGRRRGPRRGERRRQDHAGQAVEQDVRAHRRPHPRRRRGPRADAGGRVALTLGRPRSRTSSASSCRRSGPSGSATCRDSTSGRRCRPPSPGPAPRTWWTRWPMASTPSSARLGRTASR